MSTTNQNSELWFRASVGMFALAICIAVGYAAVFCQRMDNLDAIQCEHPVPENQFGPPPDAPTIDYEALNGLDPQTQATIEQRQRNNDLQFRVEHLETQVRRLNQIVLGVQEIRIGASGEPTPVPTFKETAE